MRWFINVKNLKYKGNVINPSDVSTVIGTKDANQIAYMWIDKAEGSDRSPAYDADIYEDGSDNLTLAMGIIMDNPGDPDLAKAYERKGMKIMLDRYWCLIA